MRKRGQAHACRTAGVAGHGRRSWTRRDFVARTRRHLRITQRELAGILGISCKAVQSYEQGWRPVPTATLSLLLVLIEDRRCRDGAPHQPCWEVNRCAADQRPGCLVYRMGTGRLCWTQANGRCRVLSGSDADGVFRVAECPVASRLCETLD
jgi:DNA-binding XRE family transcriptional regulator